MGKTQVGPPSALRGNFRYRTKLEGPNVPELRPWRFNLATNYNFTESRF